jgi:alpha-tubulin suppressor-like RCC1 family protein
MTMASRIPVPVSTGGSRGFASGGVRERRLRENSFRADPGGLRSRSGRVAPFRRAVMSIVVAFIGCGGSETNPTGAGDVASPPPSLLLSEISAGASHTCGVMITGGAVCWGNSDYGVLGNGSVLDQPTPVSVSGEHTFKGVSAGYSHTCGITTSSAAYCWGSGYSGQLGNGQMAEFHTPMEVSGGYSFSVVSAGYSHTCGVATDGKAYCWGEGTSGQLGNGRTGGYPGYNEAAPVPVKGGHTFAMVTAGAAYTCGVTTTGEAYCWGYGGSGRLGSGTGGSSWPRVVSSAETFAVVRAGYSHTCGITTDGGTYCWGNGQYGGLGNGLLSDKTSPVAVSGGYSFASVELSIAHTCGITTTGKAFCWGTGNSGQLGNDSTLQQTTPIETTPMAVSGGLVFSSITAGETHSCGITTSNEAYCWGSGYSGRLGNGSTSNHATPGKVGGPP